MKNFRITISVFFLSFTAILSAEVLEQDPAQEPREPSTGNLYMYRYIPAGLDSSGVHPLVLHGTLLHIYPDLFKAGGPDRRSRLLAPGDHS